MSNKQKKLDIEIIGAASLSGPENSSLFYGIPEATTVVRGKVRFTTNYVCKGETIIYSFIGTARSSWSDGDDTMTGKEILCKNEWSLPFTSPSPGKISPGTYEKMFEVLLPATLPCSSKHKYGCVEYEVQARLIRNWSFGVKVVKKVWFMPSILPALWTMPMPQTIGTCTGQWKNALPYNIAIPSGILSMGQVFPMTIRLDPFLSSSPAAEKPLSFVEARLRLKQYLTLTTTSGNTTTNKVKAYIFDVPLNWPKGDRPFLQETVTICLPNIPTLIPSTNTKVYSVRHSLNVQALSTSGLKGWMKIKIKVQISAPRPPGDMFPAPMPRMSMMPMMPMVPMEIK